jgi:hypothetical protein
MKPPKFPTIITDLADKITALENGKSGELSLELSFHAGILIAVDSMESDVVPTSEATNGIDPQTVVDFFIDAIAIATADEIHGKMGLQVTFNNGVLIRFAKTERKTYPLPRGPRLELSI